MGEIGAPRQPYDGLSDDELAARLRERGLNSSEIEIVLRDRDDLLEQILEARDA